MIAGFAQRLHLGGKGLLVVVAAAALALGAFGFTSGVHTQPASAQCYYSSCYSPYWYSNPYCNGDWDWDDYFHSCTYSYPIYTYYYPIYTFVYPIYVSYPSYSYIPYYCPYYPFYGYC